MKQTCARLLAGMTSAFVSLLSGMLICQCALAVTPSLYQAYPIVGATSEPPLLMLVLGRDHKLYYEAYNDASDLNDDGVLDVGYTPAIEYYGYFDSYKVYTYDTSNNRFKPLRVTSDKKVNPSATNEWSGDFLNYLTMSRMDCIRKVLYGGYRSTDTATSTVLERAYIPQDAHTWGKEYTGDQNGDGDFNDEWTDGSGNRYRESGYDIREYTPLNLPVAGTRHLFASTSLMDAAATGYAPLLRVLPNNANRIWKWVSKAGLVADSSLVSTTSTCFHAQQQHWVFNPGSCLRHCQPCCWKHCRADYH